MEKRKTNNPEDVFEECGLCHSVIDTIHKALLTMGEERIGEYVTYAIPLWPTELDNYGQEIPPVSVEFTLDDLLSQKTFTHIVAKATNKIMPVMTKKEWREFAQGILREADMIDREVMKNVARI